MSPPLHGTNPLLKSSPDKVVRCQKSQVRFCKYAELYVGAEHDHYFTKWPMWTHQAASDATIFRPFSSPIDDAISLLAAGGRHPVQLLPQGPVALIDDDLIAIDPTDQVLQHDDSDSSPDFDPDDQPDHALPPADWQSTLVLGHHLEAFPLRLNWNDYDQFHRSIASALRIAPENLYDAHHVQATPLDLKHAHVEAVIVHRHGELLPGSTLRLVLVDVEFHAAQPDLQPEVCRHVFKLPHMMGRASLLHALGLGAFCRHTHLQCIVWHNHRLFSGQRQVLMELTHGDYLRLAVPPVCDDTAISTRCHATAMYQGLSSADLFERHALYQLDWYDTILAPPLVPLEPDFAPQDPTALIQTSIAKNPAMTIDAFLGAQPHHCKHDGIAPMKQYEVEVDQLNVDFQQVRNLAEQPAAIRILHRHWTDYVDTVTQDDAMALTVQTWFLSLPHHPFCDTSRPVRLGADFWTWHGVIQEAWRDRLLPGLQVDLYVVYPTPPGSTFVNNHQLHLIVIQRVEDGLKGALLTTLNHDVSAAQHPMKHTAIFVPVFPNKQELVDHLLLSALCTSVSDLRCMFWHGDHELRDDDRWHVRHGFSILLVLNPVVAQASAVWDDDIDEMELMQRGRGFSRPSASSSLDPAAPVFHPGCMTIHGYDDFTHELYDVWRTSAIADHGAQKSLPVHTWFVDHGRNLLHCEHSRSVRLYEDFSQWRDIIQRLWYDYVSSSDPLEMYVVSPAPPGHVSQACGHVIVIQNPHPQLITNLLTAFMHERGPVGPALQLAATMHEHVYMERIIEGLGYASHCLSESPTHHCEVWYGMHALTRGQPWPGRSGMGLVAHLRPVALHAPVLLQLSAMLNPSPQDQARLTQGTVAHAPGPWQPFSVPPFQGDPPAAQYAVEIIPASRQYPSFIELDVPPSAASVEFELAKWGHQVMAIDCHPHNKFFCCAPDELSDLHHFLFVHMDLDDINGCFAHTDDPGLTDIQLMKLLCQFGYDRAVIFERHSFGRAWTKVSFSHQEPLQAPAQSVKRARTPWPPPQLATIPAHHKMIDLQLVDELQSQTVLRTGFTVDDLRDLFASGIDILCHDYHLFELPPEIAQYFDIDPTARPALTSFDRLLIYTDGSSRPEGRRLPPLRADELGLQDTWACLILGEKADVVHPLGWMAHPVTYDPSGQAFLGNLRIGPEQAERAALTYAGLWRLSQNCMVPTTFCVDSITTGDQAFGRMGIAEPDDSFYVMRGVFQALQAALPSEHLLLYHTKSHAGDPFNEFVDLAAKAEAVKSFNMPRQKLDMAFWRPCLRHLWMIFGHAHGLPKWRNGGFDLPPPHLPRGDLVSDEPHDLEADVTPSIHVQCDLCLATANVMSLFKGPDGHAGKLHFLQHQMKHFQINMLGIQEARTPSGLRCSNNILCLSSGAVQGQYGVELWVNLDMPLGWSRTGRTTKQYYFQRSNFCVVVAEPRRMLVRCDHQLCDCWLFIGHAPHSGKPAPERQQWWVDTTAMLQSHCDAAPLFWLLDANAAPGAPDGITVHHDAFATSASTQYFREALHAHELCLPATTDCHRGDTCTWTSIDGRSQHCIDHIAIPRSWLTSCVWSQVLDAFDLGHLRDDHQLVLVQLRWRHQIAQSRKSIHRRRARPASFQDPSIRAAITAYEAPDWTCDVETHADKFVQHLHSALHCGHPAPSMPAKKPYVTPEVWQLRAHKLMLRQQCKTLRQRLSLEALHRCFRAWATRDEPVCQVETFVYGTSLRCHLVKGYLSFRVTCRRMKQAMQVAKQTLLSAQLDQCDPSTPASTLLKVLKPFIGPTNPKKMKQKTLPLLQDDLGRPCALPNESLARWIQFFQEMEGGQRVSCRELRDQWINDLHLFQQSDFDVAVDEVPTLAEVEAAFRRVPCHRARGPDDIPGELCHFQADLLAVRLYAQVLKVAIHGQEPLLYKGGLLCPAYKGKGSAAKVTSYRSLLVSSHLGKIIHRSIRQKTADVYERYLQRQQLGGRRRIPVQLALHQARSFLRWTRSTSKSAGLLFLDLTEAFYRILRELSIGGFPTDELLAFVLQRLQLPPDSLQQLHALLGAPTALEQAGLSFTARNSIRAIHQNTHFWLPEQRDRVATYLGTRPGDSFADIIFGYTWSIVLKKLEAFLEQRGLVTLLPAHENAPFFNADRGPSLSKSFLGPTWMDDLCMCLSGSTPLALESALGPSIGYLLDLCTTHLMTANLSKGKTELMLCFHGAGSRKLRTKYYGPQAAGSFAVLCEQDCKAISLIKCYRHLGGQLHHTADQHSEVRQRIGIAHTAFNQHRKLLYHNSEISLTKRSEMFTTLVLSKLLYGADSWVANDVRTFKAFETAVLKLYMRLLRWKPHDHHSDSAILASCGLPSPENLLRRVRLRYLVVLFQCGLPDLWHALGCDRPWIELIEDDLIWMWQQLRRSSALQDPRSHFGQWQELLIHSPRYWKRLVNRACLHAVFQQRREHLVIAFHDRLFTRMSTVWDLPSADELFTDDLPDDAAEHFTAYGCMGCQLRFKNKAGEAAHMFRAHRQCSLYRHLFDTTQCSCCLKEFHTYGKLKQHLYYSMACRTELLSRGFGGIQAVAPGIGSRADAQLEQHHDRMLPPLQAHGPRRLQGRVRIFVDIDEGLHDHLIELISAPRDDLLDVDHFGEQIRQWTMSHAISWTKTQQTLAFFKDNLDQADADDLHFDLASTLFCLSSLHDPSSWPFLNMPTPSRRTSSTIAKVHEACAGFEALLSRKELTSVPRAYGRHRVILHAFAGRRRPGDIQYYLEKDIALNAPYVITTVSLDIIIDSTWGDVSRDDTRALWLRAIRSGFVLAFLAGPPCETWSRARGAGHPADPVEPAAALSADAFRKPRGLPRILRDLSELWGFNCLAIRELTQVLTGNSLLCFSIEALFEAAIAGCIGMLEHPAEPTDLKEAASIWRLPIISVLALLPGVRRRDSSGGWRTAPLKEYAPSFCKAVATAILSAFDQHEVAESAPEIPQHFLRLCQGMQVSTYGTHIGQDFAG
eukprot:s121_g25.t1